MLKRMAGKEFCSEAHRRDYQQEFSQLALGRLMQVRPGEPKIPAAEPRIANIPVPAEVPVSKSAPAAVKQVQSPDAVVNSMSPAVAKPNSLVPRSEAVQAATSSIAPAGPKAPAPPATLVKGQDPRVGKPTHLRKPAAARFQTALIITAGIERAQAPFGPERPHREPNMSPAELSPGQAVKWERRVKIADSAVHPVERKLHLREPAPATPKMELELSLLFHQSLGIQKESLLVPREHPVVPAEVSLWMSPFCGFATSALSLDDFADAQFSLANLAMPLSATGEVSLPAHPEPLTAVTAPQRAAPPLGTPRLPPQRADLPSSTPRLALQSTAPKLRMPALSPQGADRRSSTADSTEQRAGRPAPSADPVKQPAGPHPGEQLKGAENTADAATSKSAVKPEVIRSPGVAKGRVPDRLLSPLPVTSPAIAPPKAKLFQVLGPGLFNSETIRVPQSSSLPLRPLMVLGPATPKVSIAHAAGPKNRTAEVRILPPSTAAKMPSLQDMSASRPDFLTPNLVLPGLQPLQTSGGRMRKIVAAAAGAGVIAIGIVVFLSSQSDARSKQPIAAAASANTWLANFAPDAKAQRKVSILRSSTGLPAYRLDFESSIQIKALGWVYRAQDSRNFYVSKIELRKPGHTLAFVIAHYAVIDGREESRAEAPLQVAVPLGGTYKIRFDAVGDRFTTWLQNQQVDQWTDARLKTGGAGLYSEGAEKSTLLSEFQVTPLLNSR